VLGSGIQNIKIYKLVLSDKEIVFGLEV